jgi:hypothetical protein
MREVVVGAPVRGTTPAAPSACGSTSAARGHAGAGGEEGSAEGIGGHRRRLDGADLDRVARRRTGVVTSTMSWAVVPVGSVGTVGSGSATPLPCCSDSGSSVVLAPSSVEPTTSPGRRRSRPPEPSAPGHPAPAGGHDGHGGHERIDRGGDDRCAGREVARNGWTVGRRLSSGPSPSTGAGSPSSPVAPVLALVVVPTVRVVVDGRDGGHRPSRSRAGGGRCGHLRVEGVRVAVARRRRALARRRGDVGSSAGCACAAGTGSGAGGSVAAGGGTTVACSASICRGSRRRGCGGGPLTATSARRRCRSRRGGAAGRR